MTRWSARLRSRAVRLLEQLDKSGSGYREIIERELASRLVKAGAGQRADEQRAERQSAKAAEPQAVAQDVSAGSCARCGTVNDADAQFCKSCGTKLLAVLLAFFIPFSFFLLPFSAPAFAQFQMPDPKQMSGIPRPVTDLPAGHVSVRLIRGQLSNNIQGHPVEMHAGGKVLTVKTDENGRAEFSGVAAGTTVKAVAVVDGERLESQDFPWPGDGGIRVMLVATPKGGEGAAAGVSAGRRQRRARRSDAGHHRPGGRFAAGVLHPRHSEQRARTGQSAIAAADRHADRGAIAPRFSAARRRPSRAAIA